MAEPPKFITLMNANRAGLWTTLAGGVLIFTLWQLALKMSAYSGFFVSYALAGKSEVPSAMLEGLTIFVLLVGGFGPPFIALSAWRKWVERHNRLSLLNGVGHVRWGLLLASFWSIAGLGLGLTALVTPEDLQDIRQRIDSFSVFDWAILTVFYTIGIVIQAGFEEVFVRGWLLQHVHRFIPSALGSVVVTALVFTAIHWGHPGYATYVAALVFGLAYGWSVIRLNGLEAAIGAHIGNNLVGALLAGQMLSGNEPTMDMRDFVLYGAYVLGFLAFVEGWARFLEKPSRA
jgi:uncharacterized protein